RPLLYQVEPFATAGCDVRFLALPDSVIDHLSPHPGAPQRRFDRFEAEYAALHERLLGFLRVTPKTELDSLQRFLILVSLSELPPRYPTVERFAGALFPRYRATA